MIDRVEKDRHWFHHRLSEKFLDFSIKAPHKKQGALWNKTLRAAASLSLGGHICCLLIRNYWNKMLIKKQRCGHEP